MPFCYVWKSNTIWNCCLLQIIGGALRVNAINNIAIQNMDTTPSKRLRSARKKISRCDFWKHDKTYKISVCKASTRISLGVRPVWSESSLCVRHGIRGSRLNSLWLILHRHFWSRHLKRCPGKHTVSPNFWENSNYWAVAFNPMLFILNKRIILVNIWELWPNITLESEANMYFLSSLESAGNRENIIPDLSQNSIDRWRNQNIQFLVSQFNCYKIYFLLFSLKEW